MARPDAGREILMRVLPGPTKSNTVLAWSPDGRFVVAAGSGDGVTVWDVDGGTPGQRVLNAGHGGEAMRFCPRTGRLYVAFRSGGVWTFDPDTGEEHRRLPHDYRVSHLSPAVSPDGRTVVFRRSSYMNSPAANSFVGYTVADDGRLAEAWVWPATVSQNEYAYFDFAFRPRTDQLFIPRGVWNGVRAFEWVTARTGERVGALPLPVGTRVAQWALAPDGERVAWLADHALYVQHLDEVEPRVLPAGPGVYRRGLAWAPDGRTLAFTSGSTVRLLDAGTLAEVRALDWGTGKARAVAFAPDGLRAAVSAEGGKGWVTVFDLE